MPFYRVERTMAPVEFFIEAEDEEERDDMLSEIYADPHVGGTIGDMELTNMRIYLDPDPYDAQDAEHEWVVFWDEEDKRYYWK